MKTRRFIAILAVIMLAAIAGITAAPNPVEAQSADATLSALAVADGTTALSFDHPAFASGETDYYLSVANSVDVLTITPTTSDDDATVAYFNASDAAITDGSTDSGFLVNLSVGSNTVKVKVTAEDGNTTETYTISAARASLAPTDNCNAIWCANITLGAGGDLVYFGYDDDHTFAIHGGLAPAIFTYESNSYTVKSVAYEPAANVEFILNRNLPAGSYTLAIDGRSVHFTTDGSKIDWTFTGEDVENATQDLSNTFGDVITVKLFRATAPGAPRNLNATPNSATQITLTWTSPASNGGRAPSGYKIEVSSNAGTLWANLVANTASTATTYNHTGLSAETTRHYRVSAINTEGTGPASNTANATTLSRPDAPTSLSVSVKIGNVALDWDAPSGGTTPTGYELHRRTGWFGQSWDALTTTDASTREYTDSSGTAATTYFYRVRTTSAGGNSRWLSSGRVRMPVNAVPPKAHSFYVELNASSKPVLDWKIAGDHSNRGVIEMKVLRREIGLHAVDDFQHHATVDAVFNTKEYSYTDTSVQSGTRYIYRVRSVNGAGEGPWSRYRGITIP